MAFDFALQGSVSLMLAQHGLSYPSPIPDTPPVYTKTLKWRQTILSIVQDSLSLLEPDRLGENDHLWQREARQRAMNFTRLGLSDFAIATQDIAAIATLGGAYRLLAKNRGHAPIECEHIFRSFLINLISAYAPACQIELRLALCSMLLPPVKCRALVLCTGTFIQAMLQDFCNSRCRSRLDVALTQTNTAEYSLVLASHGKPVNLIGSPEFDLASRLCGIFQSELHCSNTQNGVQLLLTFPACAKQAVAF